MAVNDWAMQCLADTLGLAVERPVVTETTALGAAAVAGLTVGLYRSREDVAARWRRDRRFEPQGSADEREARYAGWRDAVKRTLSARAE
jgi:glycerol kinase